MDWQGSSLRVRVTRALVAGGVLAGMLVAGVPGIALAATPAGESTPKTEAAKQWQARLEILLKREQAILGKEETRLAQAAKVEERLTKRIDYLKGKAEDTTALEEALAEFKAAVAEARSFHETAEAALATHAGFNDSGEVVDRTEARETVKTAGMAERKFHQTMRKAARSLRQAIQEYKNEHKATATGRDETHRPTASSSGTAR